MRGTSKMMRAGLGLYCLEEVPTAIDLKVLKSAADLRVMHSLKGAFGGEWAKAVGF